MDAISLPAMAVIGAACLAMYAALWWGAGRLMTPMRIGLRTLLVLAILVPVAWVAAGKFGGIRKDVPVATAPAPPPPPSAGAPVSSRPTTAPAPSTAPAPPSAADQDQQRAAEKRAAEEITRQANADRQNREMAPPPPLPPSAPAPYSTTRGISKPAESADYDIVPVFFGTDRARRDAAQRMSYGPDRGRKLQLGEAVVTVPKNHKVPRVERPWQLTIPGTSVVIYEAAEDPKEHFTIKTMRGLSEDEFLAAIGTQLERSNAFKDHALIFVHGFNTSFDTALYRTAQIAYDLNFDGAAAVYSWPAGEGVFSYSYNEDSVAQATGHFREFVDLVLRKSGAKQVSVIAHSMGSRLVVNTMRDMRYNMPAGVKLNQLILAAPDVDADSFRDLASTLNEVSRGVTLYASSKDLALQISRNAHGNQPRAGEVGALGPMVVPGIDSVDVSALNTGYFDLAHSTFAQRTELLRDISLILQTGERPPDTRFPLLQRIEGAGGVFWRYAPVR